MVSTLRTLSAIAIATLVACNGGSTADTDLGVDTDPAGNTVNTGNTGTECLVIPDPGSEVDIGDWTSDNTNVIPEMAWPVGVVTDQNGPFYVQSILPSNRKNAYFVFEAGADMELRLRVQNSQNDFKWMHLHDGSDGCFGDEIAPATEDIGDWYIENTFDVEEGEVYVMEIRIPGGGFF